MGVFLPDLIGRRAQHCGTCVLACVFFAIWAGVSDISSSGGLIALFTLSQFALACGPSVTTFLIPAEVFPTRVRGTAHGISAASGKAGALLPAYSFATATKQIGLRGVLGLLSGVLSLVALVTLLIPEPKGKTLDEIETPLSAHHLPCEGAICCLAGCW
ncbi:general substrate transporter [Exophiala viscosa]|nr:general substrate transporter [Exophiala viscosa]